MAEQLGAGMAESRGARQRVVALARLLPGRKAAWLWAHDLQLLQGSAAFFSALIAAMDGAVHEVFLETYIFDTTGSGSAVAAALARAAQRGVRVHLTVDGFGTPKIDALWRARLVDAGVKIRVYSPLGWLGLLWPKRWHRLHRKLAVVDGAWAFCGGINILDDWHDPNYGRLDAPRWDFALQIQGQLARTIRSTCAQLWARTTPHHAPWKDAEAEAATTALNPTPALLLLRDNVRARRKIEAAYLKAIQAAKTEIIIANAYFFPSWRLRRALAQAAKRGVRVRLLLQGRYEYFLQYHGTRALYGQLLKKGMEIYEYEASFLHAKVAVIDANSSQSWVTVGSSNLDPLSLLLAREANVVVSDGPLAQALAQSLEPAMARAARVTLADLDRRSLWQRGLDAIAYQAARLLLGLVKSRF